MIQRHPQELKGTNEIPRKLKKELEKKLKLPKREYDEFMSNLDFLIDDDFSGMNYRDIANNILKEFE